MISGFYAALYAILLVVFILNIARIRLAHRISLGDGGNEQLKRKIRGHANFVETVPMALGLMMIAELSGAPFWSLHGLGMLMLVSRLIHYRGLTTGKGYGWLRSCGVLMTFAVYILGAVLCAWLSLPALLSL